MFIIIHHNIYQSLYLWYIRTIYHCGSIFRIFDIHVCELGSVSRSCECVYNGYCLHWKSYLKKKMLNLRENNVLVFFWKTIKCVGVCGSVCTCASRIIQTYNAFQKRFSAMLYSYVFFLICIVFSILLFSYSSFSHFFINILINIRYCFK